MNFLLTIVLLTSSTSLLVAEAMPSKATQVGQLLKEAHAFWVTGRFDVAFARCEAALHLDPFSSAARGLQEKIVRDQKIANNKKPGNDDAEIFYPTYPAQRVGPLPRADRMK